MKYENNQITSLSKMLSYILRHHPESIGLKLDNFGYANVDELISNMNAKNRVHVDFDTLKYIVDTDQKQRYSFNSDFSKIRANQGHSISVDLQLIEKVPPNELYHGTATRFLDSILNEGITKQSRQYVHISSDINTALKVGKRHGKPVVLILDTLKMYQDGIKFYISDNGVWLCEYVAPKYIKEVNYEK
ncbi:MAG: RNA 2'-phosphotransferase [Oscillospiraceae bacterium]